MSRAGDPVRVAAVLISFAALLMASEGPPAPASAGERGVQDAAHLAGAPAAPELPWNAHAVTNCPALLAAAGVKEYRAVATEPERTKNGRSMCHVPQAVHYVHGPAGVRYSTYMLLNCRMAAAMARFEEVANDVVRAHFGKKARLRTVLMLGAYQCRSLRDNRSVQSQHAFGGAVDIRGFVVDGFGQIDIEGHWQPGRTARSQRASAFLLALVQTLRERRVFENLLTPDSDASHKNHLHFDLDPIRPDLPTALAVEEPDWGHEHEVEDEDGARALRTAAPLGAVLEVAPTDER